MVQLKNDIIVLCFIQILGNDGKKMATTFNHETINDQKTFTKRYGFIIILVASFFLTFTLFISIYMNCQRSNRQTMKNIDQLKQGIDQQQHRQSIKHPQASLPKTIDQSLVDQKKKEKIKKQLYHLKLLQKLSNKRFTLRHLVEKKEGFLISGDSQNKQRFQDLMDQFNHRGIVVKLIKLTAQPNLDHRSSTTKHDRSIIIKFIVYDDKKPK